MKDIAVSIIMPSLNVAPYVAECVESAINQTLDNIEIISIDAGSTDGTLDILEKYANQDERIILLRSEKKSYGAQVNMGIRMAKGKYIAILETDDYVHPDMYRTLYCFAERENADFVKSDYTMFFSLESGERIFSIVKQFSDTKYYNRLLNPHRIDQIYINDYSLWKGIYKKELLDKNNVTLMETSGAAYQDIGFMEQIFASAKTAYYIDECFYFYRTDRETASTYSIHAFRNTWVEFKYFYENFVEKTEKIYIRGFFLHMVRAFLIEYEKTLQKVNYNYKESPCSDYYPWFKEKISDAFSKGILFETDYEEKTLYKLQLLLSDVNEFAEMQRKEDLQKKKYFEKISFLEETEIVIFGAGYWGCEVLKFLDNKGGKVVAFADNLTTKERTNIAGIPIYRFDECYNKFSNATYIVANEKSYVEMSQQYLCARGNADNLICLFS